MKYLKGINKCNLSRVISLLNVGLLGFVLLSLDNVVGVAVNEINLLRIVILVSMFASLFYGIVG